MPLHYCCCERRGVFDFILVWKKISINKNWEQSQTVDSMMYSELCTLDMKRCICHVAKWFLKKYHVFPLSTLGHCFDLCVVGLGTLPSHASLESGVNEYLDTDENVYNKFSWRNRMLWLYASRRVKGTHKWSVQWPEEDNFSQFISDYKTNLNIIFLIHRSAK